ncbi:hypothetical protein TrVE_jg10335 [Triparma verrucosa]|uniref:Uncharacterized protein n=1 Tax=Triparma verrucosa TaxID=1606542 RepID=A0A9W7BVC2_9STRA|nr:hypothetical protein TrVE_jg10335 [Triparma verrucosa]
MAASKAALAEILELGSKYEETRSLVGGDPAETLLKNWFLSSQGPMPDAKPKPPLPRKMVEKVEEYIGAIKAEGNAPALSPQAFDEILAGFAMKWNSTAKASASSTSQPASNLSQIERNSLLAKEILADMKKKQSGSLPEGLFKAAGSVDDDNVTRCAEDKFLSDFSPLPKDVFKRISSARKSYEIGQRRFKIGDIQGAAKAMRYGLRQMNFENKHDILYFTGEVKGESREEVKSATAQLHVGLARCFLKMSETSLQFADRLILASEAAAQANGAVDLDKGYLDAILLRGKARVQAQDFEAARLDFMEVRRQEPSHPEVEFVLADLKIQQKAAIDKEKELWKGKEHLLRSEGYTFMGEDEGPGFIRRGVTVLSKNPTVVILLLSIFILLNFHHSFFGFAWGGEMTTVEKEARRIVELSKPSRQPGTESSRMRGEYENDQDVDIDLDEMRESKHRKIGDRSEL